MSKRPSWLISCIIGSLAAQYRASKFLPDTHSTEENTRIAPDGPAGSHVSRPLRAGATLWLGYCVSHPVRSQTGPRARAAGIRCAGRGARSRLRVTGAPPAPPSETMGTRSPCPRREKKGGPRPAAEDPRSAITRSREPLTAHWRWAYESCGSFCKHRPAAASAAPIGELEPHRGPRVGTLSRGTV